MPLSRGTLRNEYNLGSSEEVGIFVVARTGGITTCAHLVLNLLVLNRVDTLIVSSFLNGRLANHRNEIR